MSAVFYISTTNLIMPAEHCIYLKEVCFLGFSVLFFQLTAYQISAGWVVIPGTQHQFWTTIALTLDLEQRFQWDLYTFTSYLNMHWFCIPADAAGISRVISKGPGLLHNIKCTTSHLVYIYNCYSCNMVLTPHAVSHSCFRTSKASPSWTLYLLGTWIPQLQMCW